jgi:hypothetical protein
MNGKSGKLGVYAPARTAYGGFGRLNYVVEAKIFLISW